MRVRERFAKFFVLIFVAHVMHPLRFSKRIIVVRSVGYIIDRRKNLVEPPGGEVQSMSPATEEDPG
ncbi:hypothetical protein B296_00015990 [Ensete ventricosum]|uniref:Uncharacterized protein n=1 Tax=Ensete ventricosum TaxID=4639 RepID=A0A426ZR50_ENSVE|nr:hypothetical protein B296_00015990 [Ensete ventricosum]